MTYSICLDQYSNNFNVNNLSSNGFSIYTNLDYNNPIASGIPYQDLFSPPVGNCSLTVNVPLGATQLLVIDNCTTFPTNVAAIFAPTTAAGTLVTSCCYSLIELTSSISWCNACNLDFDVFSSSYVGQIVAGNLTSTCGAVTDYTIGWYLNGDYSSPEFVSGYGNAFTPYSFTHPLTGNSAVPTLAGNWEGIVHDIAINGVTYSSVSGSANGLPIPFESCFNTVVVSPLTCGNGTFPGKYSHQFDFTSQALGTTPASTSFTYQLTSNIKYFAYQFSGYSISDELEIKYISGNPNATTNPTLYSNPIYLEKINLGGNTPQPSLFNTTTSFPLNTTNPPQPYIPTTFNFTNGISDTWPKNGFSYNNFKRTLTLTNLETSSNPSLPDLLEITVTPNPSNSSTNWKLDVQCLENFICGDCTFDTSPPFKISDVTLLRPTGNPCIQQSIGYIAVGCTSSNDMVGPDAYVANQNAQSPINTITTLFAGYLSISGNTICDWGYWVPSTNCTTPTPGSIITFSKTNVAANGLSSTGLPLGKIYMTFNNFADYSHYKNSLTVASSQLVSTVGPYTLTCQANSYYSGFVLTVPYQDINANCGDNTIYKEFFIHRSSYASIAYVETPQNNFYSITIPMLECGNCLTFGGCTNCYTSQHGYTATIALFNNSSFADLSNQLTYTNNNGAKVQNPFGLRYLSVYPGINAVGSLTSPYQPYSMALNRYSLETVPFVPSTSSPTGWSNLPQLGGTPCPGWSGSLGSGSVMNSGGGPAYGNGFYGNYFILDYVFPNVTASANIMNNDFKLYTKVINNSGDLQPTNTLIYTYSQSIVTVNQPSFFVGGAPNLTIQPF